MPKERIQSYLRPNPDGSFTYVKAYWRKPRESKGEIKKPKGFKQSKRVPHGDR
jgi:hypothetical protein